MGNEISKINKALSKKFGSKVKFTESGSLRFLEDEPSKEDVNIAVSIVQNHIAWQPDYEHQSTVKEF